ncbi:helix-turn-helix transcriptional regulator [Microbacterium sp. BWT-B31]|uniref:helix-turn-helix domain-containing protein n=1 Tax=Microbacterium sp. BWT-B31 TaxID=3232072 RepID=UPI003527F2E4
MALAFRNLTVSPADPVAEWGVEGMVAALERGGVDDWRKIALAVVADPAGPIAEDFAEAAAVAEASGAVAVTRSTIALLIESPRTAALRRIVRAYQATGYTQAEAARRLGTSPSRLSTYLSGKVMPSAEFLVRLESMASQRVAEVGGRF